MLSPTSGVGLRQKLLDCPICCQATAVTDFLCPPCVNASLRARLDEITALSSELDELRDAALSVSCDCRHSPVSMPQSGPEPRPSPVTCPAVDTEVVSKQIAKFSHTMEAVQVVEVLSGQLDAVNAAREKVLSLRLLYCDRPCFPPTVRCVQAAQNIVRTYCRDLLTCMAKTSSFSDFVPGSNLLKIMTGTARCVYCVSSRRCGVLITA